MGLILVDSFLFQFEIGHDLLEHGLSKVFDDTLLLFSSTRAEDVFDGELFAFALVFFIG
jgi:hypothetical protein